MNYVMTVLRIILLLFSFYGFSQHLISRLKVNVEFVLPIVFSFIGTVMFFAGILNILKLTALLVLILGLVLAVISIKNRDSIRPFFSISTILILIMSLALLFFTFGNKYLNYDNFSHWGLVTKQIINSDRFPNFSDTQILFKSYPVGSASFIYYFAKISGIRSEWFYIWIQGILTVGSLGSVFAFCKPKSYLSYFSVFISNCFLLLSNNAITQELLVDTLLPAIAIAALAICVYYRDSISKKRLLVLPITVFLITVKNSGIFFIAAILCLYLYYRIRETGIKSIFTRKELFYLLFPFLTFFLWNKHVDYVFGNVYSKHAVSITYYESVLLDKTYEIILQITKLFIKKVFSFENVFIYVIITIALIFVLYKAFKLKCKLFYELAAFLVIFYVIYQVGTYVMYLFSMPSIEALTLASYDRYHKTIIIFLCGGLLILWNTIYSLYADKIKKIGLKALMAIVSTLVITTVIYITAIPAFSFLKKPVYEWSDRYKIEKILESSNIKTYENKRYLFVWKSDKYGYYHFLLRYVLNNVNFTYISLENFNPDEVEIIDYDYLIVPEKNEEIKEYLTKNFGNSDKEVYTIINKTS